MTISRLDSLLTIAASIDRFPGACDVASDIKRMVGRAATPSMAQNTCEWIIDMCNPKARGDRRVSGMTHEEWLQFLGGLSDTAAQYGQAIFDAGKV